MLSTTKTLIDICQKQSLNQNISLWIKIKTNQLEESASRPFLLRNNPEVVGRRIIAIASLLQQC